jgi:hypothetical protein
MLALVGIALSSFPLTFTVEILNATINHVNTNILATLRRVRSQNLAFFRGGNPLIFYPVRYQADKKIKITQALSEDAEDLLHTSSM